MTEHVRRTFAGEQGELVVVGRADLCQAAADLALAAARTGERIGAMRSFGGGSAYVKASALCGKSAWRHALRRTLLGIPEPRLNEFDNLEWLRASGFGAPEPLAAGVLRRGRLPAYQFLITRAIEGAERLDAFLGRASAAERTAAIEDLGFEVARLHRMGFVHRDLHPRNLLVARGEGGELDLYFLDAWRGGRRFQLRGPAWDLACFAHDVAPVIGEAEVDHLLAAYVESRSDADAPTQTSRLRRAVERQRRALARRAAPRRADGSPPA